MFMICLAYSNFLQACQEYSALLCKSFSDKQTDRQTERERDEKKRNHRLTTLIDEE